MSPNLLSNSDEKTDTLKLIRQKNEENRQKLLLEKQVIDATENDKVWKKACEKGRHNGDVRCCWKNLGYVSDMIYDFRDNYDIQITKLFLDGNGLDSIPESLSTKCTEIVQLSLASNQISYLDDSICLMKHLTHLNLMRNNLQHLPTNIGLLRRLRVLELGNNELVEIPESIGNLKKVKKLCLQCNHLIKIPETVGKMNCVEINVSSNFLTSLPNSIGYMANLKTLKVNKNLMKSLPEGLCLSKTLRILHASGNEISELPNEIGKITSLRSLWLAFNKITALPHGFHKLRRLSDLRMEGNDDMALPNMDILSQGPKETLRWCERRFESSKHTKKRYIVMSIQNILHQVEHFQINDEESNSISHESIFRSNVEFCHEKYYQLPVEALWDIFIPELKLLWSKNEKGTLKGFICNFPYERYEVEMALSGFQDAAGSIIHVGHQGSFNDCSCVQMKRKNTKCKKNKMGWQCERPVILIRMDICLERERTEKNRRKLEEERIVNAENTAKQNALAFLETDEGKIIIRKKAMELYLEELNSTKDQINDVSSNQMHRIMNKTKNIPKTDLLNELYTQIHSKKNKILKEKEEMLRQEYIQNKCEEKRSIAIDMNKRMRVVLENWMGLSLEDVFDEWKMMTIKNKLRKEKRKKKENKLSRIEYEKQIMRHNLATNELRMWSQHWDDWNDRSYWVHQSTNECVWNEPRLEHFLPNNWVYPTIPRHMAEINDSGEGRVVKKPEEYQKDETDTSSLESIQDSLTSSSDDESSKLLEEDNGTINEVVSESISSPSKNDPKLDLLNLANDDNHENLTVSSSTSSREREALQAASRMLQVRRNQLSRQTHQES